MRKLTLHRYMVVLWLAIATSFTSFASAEPFSIETPFPQLAELVAGRKLTVHELTEILVDGVTELGDLPPDFTPREVKNSEFYPVLGSALVKKTAEVLSAQSSTKTIGLRKLALTLLPEEDVNRTKITQLVALAERIEHLEAVENAVDLAGLRPEVRDESERVLLEERITKLLRRLARRSVEARRADQAITLLAQIDPRWQEDDSRKLGSESFVAYSEAFSNGSVDWLFDDPAYGVYLDALLELDPSLKVTVAELFSVRTLQLVTAGNGEGAAISFDRVVKERPDPDDKNDKLRLQIVSAAKLPSVQGFAKGRVMDLELTGRLGLATKFKLLLTGFYGSLYPLIIFGCLSLVVFFAVISRFKPDFVLTVPRFSLSLSNLIPRKKKAVSGYKNLATTPDEFSRLLTLFSLDDSATEDDIRKAYRQKMKDLHPDASAEPENTDAFIDLKQAYERILEIQRARFSRS